MGSVRDQLQPQTLPRLGNTRPGLSSAVEFIYLFFTSRLQGPVELSECLLDKSKAVNDFVQVEVGVLPGLHGGLFPLEERRKENTVTTDHLFQRFSIMKDSPPSKQSLFVSTSSLVTTKLEKLFYLMNL